jgi:ArsR family transcriptional regulator, arsenate/arsenite/antimonite-responsive transcriptional repressor
MTSSTGEACSCEFEPLFNLSQPTISHHLKVLRQAGLISGRQDGTWVRYSIEPSAMARLAGLLESLAQPDIS